MRTATITIDSSAFAHNIQRVSELAKQSQMMVMLKANAYGHGLDVCTLSLLDNQQVQAIGVATMEEGLQVRRLGWNRTIVLIEGVFSKEEWQTAIKAELQCVIHHQQQLNWALQSPPPESSPTRTIWLKYNTGMNRLGFATDEILPISTQLDTAGYQQILTSHFANADDQHHPLNSIQGNRFSKKLSELRTIINADIQGSLCNSAGIVNFPQWHYDWVRAGIMTYGSSPVIGQTATELDLQAVMIFSAKIIAIHQLQTGEMVGYGSRWTAEKPSRIGVISIGYGDGYPRVVDDTAFVSVIHTTTNGTNTPTQTAHHCPIIGRVAMDMTVIDLSTLPNHIDINIDDTVILWGNSRHSSQQQDTNNLTSSCLPLSCLPAPHIDDIAKSAGTIGYELLCRLTTRPHRVVQSAENE